MKKGSGNWRRDADNKLLLVQLIKNNNNETTKLLCFRMRTVYC